MLAASVGCCTRLRLRLFSAGLPSFGWYVLDDAVAAVAAFLLVRNDGLEGAAVFDLDPAMLPALPVLMLDCSADSALRDFCFGLRAMSSG